MQLYTHDPLYRWLYLYEPKIMLKELRNVYAKAIT